MYPRDSGDSISDGALTRSRSRSAAPDADDGIEQRREALRHDHHRGADAKRDLVAEQGQEPGGQAALPTTGAARSPYAPSSRPFSSTSSAAASATGAEQAVAGISRTILP